MSADSKTQPARGADRRFKLSVKEPMPLSDTAAFWVPVGQAANIVMCLILLGAVLYFARPVLLPVLTALRCRPYSSDRSPHKPPVAAFRNGSQRSRP